MPASCIRDSGSAFRGLRSFHGYRAFGARYLRRPVLSRIPCIDGRYVLYGHGAIGRRSSTRRPIPALAALPLTVPPISTIGNRRRSASQAAKVATQPSCRSPVARRGSEPSNDPRAAPKGCPSTQCGTAPAARRRRIPCHLRMPPAFLSGRLCKDVRLRNPSAA